MQVVVREQIRWEEGSSLDAYLAKDREKRLVYVGPLARYAIIGGEQNGQEKEPEQYFVWTTHHSIYDG